MSKLCRCRECGLPTSPRLNVRKTDTLLHALWTKAVGTDGYDKDQWMALERLIWEPHENREGVRLVRE